MCWLGAGACCLSAPETMAPAVWAVTMLADLRHAAWLAAAAKVTGSGNWPLSRATGPATMLFIATVCLETL